MSEKLTQHQKLDLLIAGQAKILAQTKPKESGATSFGKNTDAALAEAEKKEKEQAAAELQANIDKMIAKFGGTAESFAHAIKEREEGWPDSLTNSIVTMGCWDDNETVQAFKAANPELFIR
jgi:hypothetical protein